MTIKLVSVVLLLIMFYYVPTINAQTATPLIRLPTELVTMNAIYGTNSYFDMTLTDVPLGFDIINGTYLGWCVQKNINMTQRVNHTVILYSCYDLLLPVEFQIDNWNKINYVLSHKQGTKDSIQKAIWYYTNNEDCSADPAAYAMVTEANQYGSDFIPGPGQQIAIPIQGIPTIQLSFLEQTIPIPLDLEGCVWNDLNKNGRQDKGEPGMNNIMVHLYQSDSILLTTTTTTSTGHYDFPEIKTGSYYLHFIAPRGYNFSPQNIDSDDNIDSDVDAAGNTVIFTVILNTSNPRWDAGLYKVTSSQPSRPPNSHPTADGTAGEPYVGFIHTPITFDGSRSYDRDGRIIVWRWNYGDKTNGTGEITTHNYDHPGEYTVTLTVTDNDFATDTYTTTAYIRTGNNPPNKPLISGPTIGDTNITYNYTIIATDPDSENLRIEINWDDGFSDIIQNFESGHPLTLPHAWRTYGFYTLEVTAWDPYNATSETALITIAIDVEYIENLGYLIDTNSDGSYDVFHSNSTGIETTVQHLENGEYLIDTDGDGTSDLIYNPTTHQIREYVSFPIFEYLLLFTLLITFILLYTVLRIKRQTRILKSTRKKDKLQEKDTTEI